MPLAAKLRTARTIAREFARQPATNMRFWAMRQVRSPDRRRSIADRLAGRRPAPSLTADPVAEQRAAELAREGFVMLPDLVSEAALAAMRQHLAGFRVQDPYRAHHGMFFAPAGAPRDTHIAHYQPKAVASTPRALRIGNDPRVLGIVQRALGCKPTLAFMAAWWTMPAGNGAEHAERFHRDRDDYRFFKLFLYLTDVDCEAGPHMFVKGSHDHDGFTHGLRFEDAAVEAVFGEQALVRFEGPAGTAFLENTFGLHRGLPATSKPRLIFQWVFGLDRIPYGPERPLIPAAQAEGAGSLDPYVNRVYVRF